MKKLLSLIFFSLLMSGNAYAATYEEQQKEFLKNDAERELNECVEGGKWICERSKIDELVSEFKKYKGNISDCGYVDYEAPCLCDKYEKSYLNMKYCKFRMISQKPKLVKRTRMEAADYCSNLSNRKNKEVRNEYFKSCMKDQGFR